MFLPKINFSQVVECTSGSQTQEPPPPGVHIKASMHGTIQMLLSIVYVVLRSHE